jgi:hypothetical protein
MVSWLTNPAVLMNCSSIHSHPIKSGNTEGSWRDRQLDKLPCCQFSTCSIICFNRPCISPTSPGAVALGKR